jgi:predicted DNA-binding transcriptional regulator YafY
MRTFTIDNRMEDVTLTDGSFEVPESFSIDQFLQDSFGIFQGEKQTVVIRFDKAAARYVKNKAWHPSQEIEELNGGEILVTIKATGLQDVERWIFSFGGRAEVIKPASFRAKFQQEINVLAKKYETL